MSRSGRPPTTGWLVPGLVIAAGLVVIDQLTKGWAQAALLPYRPVEVLPVLSLTLSYNTGAAFSLLANQPGWQRWFFTGIAVVVSAYLLWWLRRLPRGHRWHAAGLAGILGGAIGNVVDRLIHGHVVDFIDFHVNSWHYPAFNIADSAITLGVIVLIVGSFRERG